MQTSQEGCSVFGRGLPAPEVANTFQVRAFPFKEWLTFSKGVSPSQEVLINGGLPSSERIYPTHVGFTLPGKVLLTCMMRVLMWVVVMRLQ